MLPCINTLCLRHARRKIKKSFLKRKSKIFRVYIRTYHQPFNNHAKTLRLILAFFLPPEGEVLKCFCNMGRLSGNELENVDLHRHIIYQNDPLTKPDLMVMVPDLYRRRRRRQGRRRLPRHHLEPHRPSYIDNLYIKMILSPSRTSCS